MRSIFMKWLPSALALTLLVAASILYRHDFGRFTSLESAYGVPAHGAAFYDLGYVLDAIDCEKHAIAKVVSASCPSLLAQFAYPPIWLELGALPTGQNWTTAYGLSMALVFIISFGFVFNNETWVGTLKSTLCAVSPVTAYAIERANVDILFFVGIWISVVLISSVKNQRVLGYAMVVLAGTFKIYPIFALIAATKEKLLVFIGIISISALTLIIYIIAFEKQLIQFLHNIPGPYFPVGAFGAADVPHGMALVFNSRLIGRIAFAALVSLSLLLAFRRLRDEAWGAAYVGLGARDRTTLIAAGAVLVGCFFTAQNADYRGIFLILLEVGLLALQRGGANERVNRAADRLSWIVVALMWFAPLLSAAARHQPLLWAGLWIADQSAWWFLISQCLGLLLISVARSRLVEDLRERAALFR